MSCFKELSNAVRSPQHFFWWMVTLSCGLHAVGGLVPWVKQSIEQQSIESSVEQREGVTSNSSELDALNADAIALVQLPASALSPKPAQPSLPDANLDAKAVAKLSAEAPEVPIYQVTSLPAEDVLEAAEPIESDLLEPALLEPENVLPEEVPLTSELEDPLSGADEEKPSKPEDDFSVETTSQDDVSQPAVNQTPVSQPTVSQPVIDGVLVTLADFPHVSGSQSGCFGLSHCHQSQGNYRDVADQLKSQMRQQGYEFQEKDDIDEAGHRVWEVSSPEHPDQIYYLNVFSDGLDSAVYALTVDVLSLEELKQLNA